MNRQCFCTRKQIKKNNNTKYIRKDYIKAVLKHGLH